MTAKFVVLSSLRDRDSYLSQSVSVAVAGVNSAVVCPLDGDFRGGGVGVSLPSLGDRLIVGGGAQNNSLIVVFESDVALDRLFASLFTSGKTKRLFRPLQH